MGNQVKENGQTNGNAQTTDKSTKFVGGNPVNTDSKKVDETKKEEQRDQAKTTDPTATDAKKKKSSFS